MRKAHLLAVPIAAVLSIGTPATAQEPGSRQTRDFVQAAAQSDQFEILEGQTVLIGSKDPQILAFARQMIQDHERTSAALQQAASRAGLKPPAPSLSSDQAQLLSELQSVRGRDFDQAYARHQALAHRSALTVEQGYASSGDDAALRQVAASAVPIITGHLQMAEKMRAEMGGS